MKQPIDQQPPKSRRRWFSFSLRSLMLLVAIVSIPLGWVGWKINRARNQRAVVAELKKLYADITYDNTLVFATGRHAANPQGPKWLIRLLGEDYFVEVRGVTYDGSQVSDDDGSEITDETLSLIARLPEVLDVVICTGTGQITDKGLAHIAKIRKLKFLRLGNHDQVSNRLQDSMKITDEGLVHLYGQRKLNYLSLNSLHVTQSGIDKLRKALPNCKIQWNGTMTRADAPESAHRFAASRGEQLGDLLSVGSTKCDGWVLEFAATDHLPDWSWWILVTPTGKGEIMVVVPNALCQSLRDADLKRINKRNNRP